MPDRSIYDVRTAWTFDHSQIVSFAEILFEADVLDTARLALDFMAKPWKYQPEHDVWHKLGEPLPHDGLRWDTFIAKLEALS